ncbi:MAG: ATP-binding protein, partial [Myxococcota bacterium]
EVAAFEAEGHDPSKAHIVLYEYYAHVAHARVHQCLRAAPGARSEHLARLDGALSDLRRTARAPIAKAHAEVVGGYHAFFRGDHRGARRHFGKAERLADRENMPWVLYAVARGEAHLLRAEGYDEAARERARIAAAIAREHGAVHRLRWVGEEFDLRPSSPPPPRSTRSSTAEASSRRRRQLQTLLQVVRASSRDLHLEQQARAVLDELVNTFAAEEGYLVYESEPGQTLRIGSAGGNGKVGRAVDGPVVQRVQRTGEPWIGGPLPAAVEDADQTGHVLAAPLVIKERVVGVVTVQRGRLEEPYTPEDRDLLVALAHQVLSALELTRLLEQRERLEESLRQAQKMEAVGRLAGGIAHDFNNMLTVIEASVEALRDRSAPGRSSSSDLEMIEDAAQRAKTLTRQLLAFSRRQVVHPEVHEPNAILSDLAPMLGRLIGEHIKVELQLDPHAHPVKVDRSFFEQAIVNLAANARDAMPKGGTITLLTENLVLDEEFTRDRPSIRPGPHVHVAVSDTGEGMPPDVQARIFDPFFTTKQLSGTGLGLSTVYGFATQSEGYIEVESETGRGTTFHLYLPKAREALRRPSTAPPAPRERMGSETVLLVEDERLVRNSVRRILQRAGYRVLTAEGGREALGLADRHGKEIALVVTDVLMPDMSGPELVERLRERLPNARVLYMSGYTDGHLVAHGVLEEGVSLLHKPFTSGELQERIRELLDDQ